MLREDWHGGCTIDAQQSHMPAQGSTVVGTMNGTLLEVTVVSAASEQWVGYWSRAGRACVRVCDGRLARSSALQLPVVIISAGVDIAPTTVISAS